MSFEKNATPLLKAAVAAVAPEGAAAECPCEAVSERKQAIIRLRVAREVFGRSFQDSRQLATFLDKGDYAETSRKKCRLSQEMLPFDGIGEDSFFLNEYFGDGGPYLSGFNTLMDWDRHSHDFQESCHAEEGRRPEGPLPYEGRLLWDWARWLDCGRLVYGNLSVAGSALEAAIEEHAADLARSRYRTDFVKGPDHGTRTEGGHYKWDIVETPEDVAELRFASDCIGRFAAIAMMKLSLKDALASSGVWVSRIRREEDGEINENVVFSGPEAMARARFRNWLGDLDALADGTAVYAAIEEKAREDATRVMNLIFDALDEVACDPAREKRSWRTFVRAGVARASELAALRAADLVPIMSVIGEETARLEEDRTAA
jgi:hypothetical protein